MIGYVHRSERGGGERERERLTLGCTRSAYLASKAPEHRRSMLCFRSPSEPSQSSWPISHSAAFLSPTVTSAMSSASSSNSSATFYRGVKWHSTDRKHRSAHRDGAPSGRACCAVHVTKFGLTMEACRRQKIPKSPERHIFYQHGKQFDPSGR